MLNAPALARYAPWRQTYNAAFTDRAEHLVSKQKTVRARASRVMFDQAAATRRSCVTGSKPASHEANACEGNDHHDLGGRLTGRRKRTRNSLRRKDFDCRQLQYSGTPALFRDRLRAVFLFMATATCSRLLACIAHARLPAGARVRL